MNLVDIDCIIVGDESGQTPRSMKEEWALDIMDQCKRSDFEFFFKQWGGGTNKRKQAGNYWTESGTICQA